MKNIFLLIILVAASLISNAQTAKKVNSHELAVLLDESLLIIDGRTAAEYSQGFIPGAVNIDFYSKTFVQQTENYDRNRSVYLYCRNGSRSWLAADQLISSGFKNIFVLDGGFIRWEQDKKPINH
jgi:phage shock protein E